MNKVYRRETRSSSSKLPTELLTNIFRRLPVKIILQLRSVCKTWYAILTDSSFISMHANWRANNHTGFLTCLRLCRIQRLDERFEFLENLKFPVTDSYKFDVIGSCNGLLCLTNNDAKHRFPSTYLWNPSIRAYKKLPKITDSQYRLNGSCISGFGFDTRTDDYKVFHTVLQKLSKKEKVKKKLVSDYVIINRLYSVKTDSWKVIQGDDDDDDDDDYYDIDHGYDIDSSAYFDGAFYWIPISYKRLPFIMWFDFCDEKICKAKLPIDRDDDDDGREKLIYIRKLGDKLALFLFERVVFGRGPCSFNIGTMKKEKLGSDVTWDRPFSVVLPALQLLESANDSFTFSESMFSQESWTRY